MAVTFYTQSKKESAPIYIRVRSGKKIDAKARTNFYIQPKQLEKGNIKYYKNKPGSSAIDKAKIKERNEELMQLESNLNDLRSEVVSKLNNRESHERINSNWLKRIVNPIEINTPTTLIEYFEYYFDQKKTSLQESTVTKLRTIQNRLKKYQEENGIIYIVEVNRNFRKNYFKWSDKQGYAHNTKIKTIKVLYTLCNHAKEEGIKTHPELESITAGLKYQKTPHVYLSLLEIEKIRNEKLPSKRLDIARDWLIISCFTAQRVSDFLKFTAKDIIEIEGGHFLDINQQKTETPVYIPLNGIVMNILKKYEDGFPPTFSNNSNSNEVIYNRLIKKVCRMAKIDTVVKANLRQTKTNRYEIKEVPKWKAVSSHIGRRSFATNYYGKINTALLISATGHASEKQFLTYVGKKPRSNALELAREMRKLEINRNSGYKQLKKV